MMPVGLQDLKLQVSATTNIGWRCPNQVPMLDDPLSTARNAIV